MAAAVVRVNNIKGYTTVMGNRGASVKNLSWDTGNYPAGGLTFYKNSFGLRGFDWVNGGGVTVGGNYIAEAQVASAGAAQFKIRLIVLATGVEVATNAALTADSVNCFAVGG